MPTAAQELYERSVDLVRHGQVRPALGVLLEVLAADPRHGGAIEAAGRICRVLGAPADAELFERLAADPDSAPALYDLGYRLVEQARPDAAAALLQRCLDAVPERIEVRRELAYARLQNREFDACLATLAPLRDEPGLSETERLDVLLVQAEAAIDAGRRALCRELLAQADDMVADDSQRERLDALHALVGRSMHWDTLAERALRDWHFIQHAGIILKTAGGYFEDASRGGRFDVLDLRPDMVAFLLQRLAHLLETFALEHEVVAATSETAAPLAAALARVLGVPWVPELVERGSRSCLLVAANAAELGPLAPGLARHTAEVRVASLNLDWERDAPVCPEVAGVLARRVLLPWETRYAMSGAGGPLREVPGDVRPADEIGAELAALTGRLPDDGGRARAEFEGYYAPLRDELVLGNEARYPHRRRFTSLSPCWPAPGGATHETLGPAPDLDEIPDELLDALDLDERSP